MPKVIVSLASWPPRAPYIAGCVESLLNQTLVPTEINLNLSALEWENREASLPDDVQKLINDNKLVVNWEEGNTYCFRKEIPVVKKYWGQDALILSVDDDVRYDELFVEKMVENLGDYDAYNSDPGVVGFRQIARLTKYNPDFWLKCNQEVIDAGISDTWNFWWLTSVGARCKWGPEDKELCNMCKCVAGDVSPNSERIGGYNVTTMTRADKASRKALGLC